MKKNILNIVALSCLSISGCDYRPSSDQIQQKQQEKILQEGISQVGTPAIKNFREKKILKDILELRDQEGLVTYTYIINKLDGKLIFFGNTIGYPIPYSTQFTNPQKMELIPNYSNAYEVMPQAEPNGLFSPSSAEASWVLMKDPHSDKVSPVYVEERLTCSPFKLH